MRSARISLLVSVLFLSAAYASAQTVVISQVYGGGGNSGATWRNDFVELFNAGSTTTVLNGWSIQYASSAGTSWQAVNLAGSLAPGQYYLIQLAAGAGGTQNLPAPNATGDIAMSSSSAKVALSNSTAALSGSCPTGVVDLVGYGTANCFEGAGPTPALTNTTAAIRGSNGCTDTNNNSADFATGTPNPRNTASPLSPCQATTNPVISGLSPNSIVFGSPTFTLQVSGANFVDGATVNWNGSPLATVFGSAASLSATVPSALVAAPGTATVTVVNPDTQVSNGSPFLITGPPVPTIGSLSPNSLIAGSAAFVLTVNGANFANGAYVGWNDFSLPTTFVNSGQVTAQVPASLVTCPGTGRVTVTNPDNQKSVVSNFTIASPGLTFGSCAAPLLIGELQGPGSVSPIACGSTVSTTGIVTGRRSNGFFLQSPAPGDNNAATSDGIFVFTSSAPPSSAAVGDQICVTGTLTEFRRAADAFAQPLTEITSPTVTSIASGQPLPAPIVLNAADTNPAGGLDILERYEGMRVQVNSLTVVAPTDGSVNEANATSTTNGVFYGVIQGIPRPFREPGIPVIDPLPAGSPCCIPLFDNNPERIRVDSDALGGAPLDVTAGATVSNLVGPLDWDFQTYSLLPDPTVVPTVSGNATATPVPAPNGNEFTIASFNMERFYDTNDDPGGDTVLTPAAFNNRLNKASLTIRNILRTPDVVGVQEVENLSALQALAARINADALAAGASDPGYQAYLEEGNDPGGIDVGFLVKNTVAVGAAVQEGKNATYINPNNGQSELLNDRPPLRLNGTIQGLPFTVVVNHLRSLGSIDDPLDGNRVRAKRRAQAEYLANLVQARQAADPTERIVLVGDFNAFEFNDGYVDSIGTIKGTPAPADAVVLASPDLVNPDLTNLIDTLAPEQRYTYSFDGNAQVLDHILINGAMQSIYSRLAVGRSNVDFPEVLRNDPNRPERITDHDQPVAYFRLPNSAPVTQPQTVSLNFGQAGTTFALSVTDPENNPLTFSTVTGPLKGTVTYDNTNKTATYTPNAGVFGTDTFTYRATDTGGLSATGVVTIEILPVEVTAQVSQFRGNLVFDSRTNTWVGVIQVTNTGTQPIAAPLKVVISGLPAGVTLTNALGTFNGNPYVQLSQTAPLAPRVGRTATVRFSNPSAVRITYTSRVYSGL